jgi:hypothetical protein
MAVAKRGLPKKMEKLVGAALLRDAEYRALLFKDPAQAAKLAGITLTDQQLQQVQEVMGRLDPDKFEKYVDQLHSFQPPHAVAW